MKWSRKHTRSNKTSQPLVTLLQHDAVVAAYNYVLSCKCPHHHKDFAVVRFPP